MSPTRINGGVDTHKHKHARTQTRAHTKTHTQSSSHTFSSVTPEAVINTVSQGGCVTAWWKRRAAFGATGMPICCVQQRVGWGGFRVGGRKIDRQYSRREGRGKGRQGWGVGGWGCAVTVSGRALGRLQLQEGDIQLHVCIKSTLQSTQKTSCTEELLRGFYLQDFCYEHTHRQTWSLLFPHSSLVTRCHSSLITSCVLVIILLFIYEETTDSSVIFLFHTCKYIYTLLVSFLLRSVIGYRSGARVRITRAHQITRSGLC